MKTIKEGKKMGLGYILELATGHYRAKVLFVACNLKIFNLLSEKPKTLEKIAEELNISLRPARMLLNACVALGLLEKNNEFYSNSRTADIYLVEGKPQYMEPAFFKFDEHSYLLFDKLEEAILTDSPKISQENAQDPELLVPCMLIGNRKEYRNFLSALDPIAQWPANVLANRFDFSSSNTLIDIGGGSGVYSIAIVKKNPHMRAIVFDLPYVCEIGDEMMKEKGLSHRIKYHSGDYFKDEFPKGFDVALISNIIHGYGPETCHFLLKKIYNSLPSGGSVIISDLILDDDGCSPAIAVLLSLYFLLITEEGRNYTLTEYKNMLENAGFVDIKSFKSSGETRFVTGLKK